MSKKSAEDSKHIYGKEARTSKIKVSDLVLVWNVTLRGKLKIADRWKNETIYGFRPVES